MPFTFRNSLESSDPAAIGRLVAGTGFFRNDEIAVAVELAEERLAKGEDSGYNFWLAETGGLLAGYVCFGPTPCTIGSYDLYWIAVDAAWQGQGLGRQLCVLTEDSVRAAGGRMLYVETSGKELYRPTQQFYMKAGYHKAAELPDFYDIGDAKIIFSKCLSRNSSTGV